MASASKPRTVKGFTVVCPNCLNPDGDGAVLIELANLSACRCTGCDAEFTPREAAARFAERAAQWAAVERWIAMAGDALATPPTTE